MSLLKTNAAVLAKLVQDSPLAIVMSTLEDGRILDVNDTFEHLTGYTRDEVIGQTSLGLDLWANPMQRAELMEALRAEHPVRDFEVSVRSKTGEECQALASVEHARIDGEDCLLTQMYDVTHHRQVETRFQALVEQLPVITYVHGLEVPRTLTYISPQVETIVGYSPAEVLAGQPDSLIGRVHPEDQERLLNTAEESLRTFSPYRVEYRVRAADDHWVWLQDQASVVLDARGRPLHWQGVLVDITERKGAEAAAKATEAALREDEERYRALVQNSYDNIVVFDAAGTRKYVSPSVEHLLGYPPADLLGRSPVDLVHPDDASLLQEAIQSCLRGAKVTPVFELRFRHRDGSWRNFEAVGTNLLDEPSVNGIVFNSRDITPRKAEQAALRESEARFRSAFEYAPIGIAILSPDGRFMQVNRALCELVGYPEEELLGSTFQAISHPEDLADDLEQAARLWAGEIDTYQLEMRYLHKDGRVIWIHLTSSVVRYASGPKYSIAQILDITGRRHVEMDRAIMLASEREYTRQLRALTEMRSDLTAMIAHELRAPVAALRMMTFLIATGELSIQDEGEMFAAVKSEIEQLDRLINDVADVTTAEREDFSVQLNPVPLDLLFENAAAYARVTVGDHPFTVPPVSDVRVWCDPERISQVLRNLLDNAVKHTPPGTAVALRAHREGTRVHIAVADHGPGLSTEDIDSVFEKFGRGHSAAARQTPGAGLGLYLSRQIVQAHGSELTVTSAPGTGTVFAFDLEVAP